MRSHAFMGVSFFVALILAHAGCRRDPLERGLSAISAGNAALAESLLAHGADSNDPTLLANLALARMKLGQIDAAMSGFRQAADLVPEDPRPLEYMAMMAAEDSRWRMCHQLLLEASRRDPRSPRIQTALANVELRTYGAQTAATRLAQVLISAPNYSPALFNLALINKETLNNAPEARRLLERYITISTDPEHLALARQFLAELQAPAPASQAGKLEQSASQQTRSTRRSNGTSLYNQGVRLHATGKLDDAMQAYAKALEADPGMANAHYNLGLIHKARNDQDAARIAFEQALELQPGFSDARYMLACVLRDQGKPQAAIEQWETLVSANPGHAQSLHALGLLYKDSPGTRSKARRCFERYLEIAPAGPHAKTVRDWLEYNK